MYNPDTESVVSKFSQLSHKNAQFLSEKGKDYIAGVETLIDIQCKIASYFVGFWTYPGTPLRKGRRELMPLLFSLFHRNFFSYYSALKLTMGGFYISARPLMRNIFESLLIAKFCHISDDVRVMKRWDSGATVYFTNSILKKIINPNPKPFYEFWHIVCEQTHATKSSFQLWLELEEDDNLENVLANLAILNALLECSYHLLNTHLITPELNYMAKFYTTRAKPKIRNYEIPDLRKRAHSQFRKNRRLLGSESIKLISAYKRKWLIKK